ncbi:MAG: nucleotidyltransferase domain-containing protein [Candidatus Altiarchaeota archaeon]
MKPKRPLRKYGFGSWDSPYNGTDYLLLTSFFPEAKTMTIQEIMDATGFTYEPVYRSLKTLTKDRIVAEEKVGKVNLYRIDPYTIPASMAYLQCNFFKLMEFANHYPIVYKMLKTAVEKAHPYILVLYGSYARLEAKKRSDIDLMVVDTPMNKIRHIPLPDYSSVFHTLEMEYDVEVNQTVTDYFKFMDIKKDNPPFWETLKNEGIVVEGWEYTYNEYYK